MRMHNTKHTKRDARAYTARDATYKFLCLLFQHSTNVRHFSRSLSRGIARQLSPKLSWLYAARLDEQHTEHGSPGGGMLQHAATLYQPLNQPSRRVIRAISALIVLIVSGCTADLRNELDKMTLLQLRESEVAPLRMHIEESFNCPDSTTHAYFLGELDLSTNETRIGIRCQ
jgi:hypothetical protein